MVHKIRRGKIEDEVFELTDIFEEPNEKNIENNIKEVLKREKLWGSKYNIVFPAGALAEVKPETKKESGFYQYDFEVFSSHDKIAFIGTAYGQIQNDEMLDMNVELKRWK